MKLPGAKGFAVKCDAIVAGWAGEIYELCAARCGMRRSVALGQSSEGDVMLLYGRQDSSH
jgi:hypothetical protein